MPIYEYRCSRCEHQFDLLQKITDDPVDVCPECGGPVTKLVSSTSFVLKGSGWYVTDYGKGGDKGKDNSAKSSPVKKESSDSKEKAVAAA
ncbi:MAG: zinc ribbon domain-containing protein [Deltaproteobacteria bacterium]|nr:zinc ribbon domain-containing protein [Candidatus Anaeroferrophillus wilburensis]MBN2889650.1 zinc ribbon domain-containing protein [Deltaproteobacteria bacterium]